MTIATARLPRPPVWYQAQHLDVGFYDAYYPREAVPEHIRNHMRDWHGGQS